MKAKRKHKTSKNPKPSSRAAVPTDVLRILRDYPHQSYSVLRQAFPSQVRDSYMLGQGNGACRRRKVGVEMRDALRGGEHGQCQRLQAE